MKINKGIECEIKHEQTEKKQLIASLRRMYNLHNAMCKKINFKESFLDADTIVEMNLAPLEAHHLLKELEKEN